MNRDSLARAINESKAGILVRFDVGQEWWTASNGQLSWDKKDIEPLRKPKVVISGHAVTQSNFDGGSFRIANTWGPEWSDNGTAYHLLTDYRPTEAFVVFYDELPKEIEEQILNKEQKLDIKKKITSLFDIIIELIKKL